MKYVITSNDTIDALGGITGPITTPMELDIKTVITLVKQGVAVYQTNPYDANDRVRVTLDNYSNITFKRKRASITSDRLLNRSIQEMSTPITPKFKDIKEDKEKKNGKKEKKQAQAKKVQVEEQAVEDSKTDAVTPKEEDVAKEQKISNSDFEK